MELAKIIRRYEKELSTKSLLPQQRKALNAIARCRTPASGEMHVICPCCSRTESYCLSCGNRNCPKCQNFETTKWIERQQQKHLPVDYYMVTFTIPAQLRTLVWNNQKKLYDLLFKTASTSLRELAKEPRFLGGNIGMTGVLHTHNRRLDFHPHLHFIVPSGALSGDKKYWLQSSSKFLVPQTALNKLFRGKFLAGVKELKFSFPEKLYKIDWVVDCRLVGKGEEALQYLSRYLYRGVLSEKNILSDEQGKITFAYIESKTGVRKHRTLPGGKFLELLLKHVLPQGFRRVRDYGFLHGNAKKTLILLQLILKPKIREEGPQRNPQILCPDCEVPMVIFAIISAHIEHEKRGSPTLS